MVCRILEEPLYKVANLRKFERLKILKEFVAIKGPRIPKHSEIQLFWNSEIQVWELLLSSCGNETIYKINEYKHPMNAVILCLTVY